jgi:hypothetical protein
MTLYIIGSFFSALAARVRVKYHRSCRAGLGVNYTA